LIYKQTDYKFECIYIYNLEVKDVQFAII